MNIFMDDFRQMREFKEVETSLIQQREPKDQDNRNRHTLSDLKIL